MSAKGDTNGDTTAYLYGQPIVNALPPTPHTHTSNDLREANDQNASMYSWDSTPLYASRVKRCRGRVRARTTRREIGQNTILLPSNWSAFVLATLALMLLTMRGPMRSSSPGRIEHGINNQSESPHSHTRAHTRKLGKGLEGDVIHKDA